MKDKVYQGTVKFFKVVDDGKGYGYGFIIEDESQKDYFVHLTGIKNKMPLRKGARVSFQVCTSKRGLKATEVVGLD